MRRIRLIFIGIFLIILTACDPLAYNPTPVSVVITVPATETPVPTITNTPTMTPTPSPSPTPFVPTPTPFPCEEETGQYINFDDNESLNGRGENLRFRVYVPPCYSSSEKRFPVLYLLHGLSYAEDQWEDLGLDGAIEQGIRLRTLPPMIVVMPYLGNLGQTDTFPPDPSYESFLLDELMPQVQGLFCMIENREHRAIGGISRGGFWALSVAMRHPDIFGIVGGHSAYLPIGSDLPPAFNPMELALNETFLQEAGLRIWLDNGAGDPAGSGQQLFDARLSQRSIPHNYTVHPTGEHNNDYWTAHLQEYLVFYGRDWERDYGALPPCNEPSP